jgi:hypothetical protein
MFDELLNNPLVLVLPHVLSVVFGFLVSRTVELVPAFSRWWGPLPDHEKLAFRGWAGLVLAVILVTFGYFSGLIELELTTTAEWLSSLAAVLISWLLFVGGAEGTYRLTKDNLPRNQPQY